MSPLSSVLNMVSEQDKFFFLDSKFERGMHKEDIEKYY